MGYRPGVILVDDETAVPEALARSLRRLRPHWGLTLCDTAPAVLETLQASPCDVLISDFRMPGMDGLELITRAKGMNPAITCFLLTGTGDYTVAVRALNSGLVAQYFTKPCAIADLIKAIEARLEDQHSGLASLSGVGRAALEVLSTGVFVVDSETGRILHANRAAEQILGRKDGLLRDGQGILRAAQPLLSQRLHNKIHEVAQADQGAPVFLLFTRPSGEDPYRGVIKTIGEGEGSVVVLISDPVQNRAPPPEALIALYGLTPSEALIAYTLAQGESLEHAALTSGITVSSARTYLKRVFAKTDVRSQGELVSRVLTLPGYLRRHG
ncbi:response regulator [Woodsholea maritima]|uniref:response regulator n=1 Tax=Woodsholea maritima TaxID=240237 RepID=UPI0003809DCE|nr:response regulator [Woodsholea maritima]